MCRAVKIADLAVELVATRAANEKKIRPVVAIHVAHDDATAGEAGYVQMFHRMLQIESIHEVHSGDF